MTSSHSSLTCNCCRALRILPWQPDTSLALDIAYSSDTNGMHIAMLLLTDAHTIHAPVEDCHICQARSHRHGNVFDTLMDVGTVLAWDAALT